MKTGNNKTVGPVVAEFAMLPEESLLTRLTDRLKNSGLEAAKLWTMAAMAGVCIDAIPALVEIGEKPGRS